MYIDPLYNLAPRIINKENKNNLQYSYCAEELDVLYRGAMEVTRAGELLVRLPQEMPELRTEDIESCLRGTEYLSSSTSFGADLKKPLKEMCLDLLKERPRALAMVRDLMG